MRSLGGIDSIFSKIEFSIFKEMNIKIAIIGASGVGKTAFINRHTLGEFTENHQKTEEEKITILDIETNRSKICISLYDNAKDYKDMDAFILMVDAADLNTIEYIKNINIPQNKHIDVHNLDGTAPMGYN